MTRVAVISTYPTENVPLGGVANYTKHLVTALREMSSLDVVVFAQRRPPPSGSEAEETWLPGLLLPWSVDNALRRSTLDVVHIQHEPFLYGQRAGAGAALLLPFLVRRRRLGCVMTLHAVPFPSLLRDRAPSTLSVRRMSAAYLCALRQAARAVDTFIVHDPDQARTLVDFAGIPKEKIATIPQGVQEAPVRQKKKAEGLITIGIYGFLAPYKDPDYLLDEFALLRTRMPDASLLFSLSRHPRRRDHRSEASYRRIIARARQMPGVSALGHLSEEELKGFFESCDIIVNPYRYAVSSSAVLAQASGAGVPVLVPVGSGEASRIPGWSFEYKPNSLAEALERQANSLPVMALQAQEFASSRAWADIAVLHREQYEGLARG